MEVEVSDRMLVQRRAVLHPREDTTKLPREQFGGRQAYNDYQNGYAYDGQGGGYRDDGARRYQDNYVPGPGRGGPMHPYAKEGGSIPRPGTADGTRGGPYPQGRGMGPGVVVACHHEVVLLERDLVNIPRRLWR